LREARSALWCGRELRRKERSQKGTNSHRECRPADEREVLMLEDGEEDVGLQVGMGRWKQDRAMISLYATSERGWEG
jgi:hypothetical protein